MFIDSVLQEHQAPLGAACQRRNVQWTHMPLLTELEDSLYGPPSINMALLAELSRTATNIKYAG